MEARNDIPLHSVSPVSPVSPETLSHEANISTSRSHEDEIPPYEETNEDVLPPYQRSNPVRSRSTPLRRNIYFLVPVAIYTCMAAYSWVTLCLFSRTDDMVTNKNNKVTQYRAARVLHTITSVATIPTISFVCAWAAAVYVQNQPDAHSLRLRQVMTLADRGWMDPRIWFRLVFYPSGFKRYGSAFLVLAIFMHIIGAITYPIQSLFLSHRLVYVEPVDRWGDVDFDLDFAQAESIPQMLHEGFVGTPIFTLRNELQTPGINGFQSQLWGNNGVLSEINSTTNWFAQLPNNFTSGPYSDQYIPRVNSSVSIRNMTAGEFPTNCSETQDWFYAFYFYKYPGNQMNLTVEVCVPINGTNSPWKDTDGRQDFSEVLYVNTTIQYAENAGDFNIPPFIVTMNTTAGVFRLPNLVTNQTPGPLETNSSLCFTYSCGESKSRRQYEYDYFEPALPGPLTLIALAMFGPGSFADTQQNATDTGNYRNDTGWKQYFDSISNADPLPLMNLGVTSYVSGDLPIETWILALTDSGNLPATTSAFTQASFLAVKAIFDSYSYGEIDVSYSSSALEQISLPSMPLGALIAGSVLLILYIIPLLGLALYSAASYRWTHTLDAFTMLRMGAAFGQEHLPFLIGKSMRKIQALDDLPGVVRDISLPDDKVRQLALGVGGSPLQLRKPYLAYPGNHYHVP